ncbi:hypothetical protein [Chitinophaga defluvii]|uniref:Uncharacterized protein n=1 Tax=Chitinophaga defluvii TaxID=3163343 RepID=A0ABV2T3Q2_9BACT
MTMQHKTDDFIRNRLIWKAKKYGLPSAYSLFYDDLPLELKENLAKHVTIALTGTPVLFFTKPTKEWTLVCTRQLIGYNNHELYSVPLKTIGHITSRIVAEVSEKRIDLLNGKNIRKSEWEELIVRDIDDNVFLFHAYKGADLFALWNVVLMVSGE